MKRYSILETDAMAAVLKEDGVLAVPTDTVYGLCARMNSMEAQANLARAKNRPKEKSFPVMCSSLDQIRSVAKVNKRAERVINTFMPGPLTIVLPVQHDLPSFITNGKKTIAVRMASSKALEELIEKTGEPVFMTSANQSGRDVCRTPEEIEEACPLAAGIMEGSPSFGKASTIIDACNDEIVVLRSGPLTKEEIEEVWNDER